MGSKKHRRRKGGFETKNYKKWGIRERLDDFPEVPYFLRKAGELP